MNKKALELSLTVIVLIILTIIIFIGGIALTWQLFTGAEEIKMGIEKSTKDQIEALLREGNELVTIPINKQTLTLGKEAVFGLGIRNILEQEQYHVRMDFEGLYDKKGKTSTAQYDPDHIETLWLGSFQQQSLTIKTNQHDIIPLRVRAATTIAPGITTPRNVIAVFNVCVSTTPLEECKPGAEVYDRIKQVFVEIK